MEWERNGQWGLPNTGRLSTGQTVSGYNFLDDKTLEAEGWLKKEKPVVENVYVEPEPTIEDRVAALEGKVATLEGEGLAVK